MKNQSNLQQCMKLLFESKSIQIDVIGKRYFCAQQTYSVYINKIRLLN